MKKKKVRIKASFVQFAAIIALSISVFLIIDFGRRAAASYRIQREAERLTQEIAAAKRYQSRLLAQRTYAASDLYVEEVARNELKWAKPGETVIIVLPTPEVEQPIAMQAKAKGSARLPVTPQQAWWQLFFSDDPPP